MPKRSTTNPAKPTKPDKPRPDFPLFPHATRRWAKKIRGKLVYFGPWDDPQGALDRYLADAVDLHAGRVPRKVDGEAVALRDVVNHFLTAKQRQLEAGELKPKTSETTTRRPRGWWMRSGHVAWWAM